MDEDPRPDPPRAVASVSSDMTRHAVEERLNRLAQDLDPLDDGDAWFRSLSFERRQGVLRVLAAMTMQAHPSGDAVGRAVQRSGLKPTYTPVVLPVFGAAARSVGQDSEPARGRVHQVLSPSGGATCVC